MSVVFAWMRHYLLRADPGMMPGPENGGEEHFVSVYPEPHWVRGSCPRFSGWLFSASPRYVLLGVIILETMPWISRFLT